MAGQINIAGTSGSVQLLGNDTIVTDINIYFPPAGGLLFANGNALEATDITASGSITSSGQITAGVGSGAVGTSGVGIGPDGFVSVVQTTREASNCFSIVDSNNGVETFSIKGSGQITTGVATGASDTSGVGIGAPGYVTVMHKDRTSQNCLSVYDTASEKYAFQVAGTGECKIGTVSTGDGSNSGVKLYPNGLTEIQRADGAGGRCLSVYGGNSERAFIDSAGKINSVAMSLGSAYIATLPADGYLLVDKGVYVGSFAGESLLREVGQSSGSNPIYIGNQQIQVSSDVRIKTDIEDTKVDATERLKEVRVVDFAWNDPSDDSFNNKNARGRWTGVIAQELVDIFPFAVNAPRSRETNGAIDHESEIRWNVNQDQLVPVLIKGFQEQQKRIEALEAELAALKS